MTKPKLSTTLSEDLKKHSKKDRNRRLLANVAIVFIVIVFVILAKVYVFKGDIKINDQQAKTPSEKIENTPKEDKKEEASQTAKEPSPAPAPAPPPPAEDKGYTTYVIKEGDTLSGIANANGMTSKQLMDYNGIVDPASILPGQSIKIPK